MLRTSGCSECLAIAAGCSERAFTLVRDTQAADRKARTKFIQIEREGETRPKPAFLSPCFSPCFSR